MSCTKPPLLAYDTNETKPNAKVDLGSLIDHDVEEQFKKKFGSTKDIPDHSPPNVLSPSLKSSVGNDDGKISVNLKEEENLELAWSGVSVFMKEQSRKRTFSCWPKTKQKYEPMKSRQILTNVYGVAQAGQLLAIMGGSGAGKTTLLNILTKRNLANLNIEGKVLLNGRLVSASVLRSISAYVQQDDLFIGTLKVKEHLMFQALLRMGKTYSNQQRMERVNDVITELGLGKCENTLIGVPERIRGISGGERKRLAFASEILTDPPLMFCDEPTSGLDSFMAQQVARVLKSMAKKGKTVVCTIHQPSSPVFEMFDQLCLMADGKICWLGPKEDAAKLFESFAALRRAGLVLIGCPLIDHYIRVLAIVPNKEQECHTRVEVLFKAQKMPQIAVVAVSQCLQNVWHAYEESEQGRTMQRRAIGNQEQSSWNISVAGETSTIKKSRYKATWMQQLQALMWRSFLGIIREPLLLKIRLYETIVLGFVMGLIYLNTQLSTVTIMNINGVLFLFVSQMTFQFVFGVVNVFCEELPVFMREHLNGSYRVDAYYISKILSEFPQYIILPVMFTTILYWMAGLTADAGVFFTLCGINILSANVAVSLGYMISCISGNENIALSLISLVVIPFMLFGGFFLNQDTIPVYFIWLKYLSYFKYGYEAVSINYWRSIKIIPGSSNATYQENGHEVLKMLSFDEDRFILDILALVIMMVGIRILGFLALLIRTYVKK